MKHSLLLAVLLCPVVFSKVFERCDLVRELSRAKHRIPRKEVATWVCIAQHESQFNTSVVGHLNADLSGDHGLFQISDQYWCSPPGVGLACGLNCDQLEDDDITDDIVCARRIYRSHKRRTGDGFSAWAVYGPHCQGDVSHYTEGCELEPATTRKPRTTLKPRTTTEKPTTEEQTTTNESPVSTSSETSSIYFMGELSTTTDSEEEEVRVFHLRTLPTHTEMNAKGFITKKSSSMHTNTVAAENQAFSFGGRQSHTRTLISSAGGRRPTSSKEEKRLDPQAAWLSIHNHPRFLDEFP